MTDYVENAYTPNPHNESPKKAHIELIHTQKRPFAM